MRGGKIVSIITELKDKYGKRLLSESNVARELGVSKKDVKVMCENGDLPYVKIEEKLYIPLTALAVIIGEENKEDHVVLETGLKLLPELEYALSKNTDREDAETLKYSGSISKLKDGRIMVQIQKGKKADGSRDRESKSFRDESLAKQYLDSRLAQLNGVEQVSSHMPIPLIDKAIPMVSMTLTDKTFSEYAVEILNNGVGKAGSRTIEGYRLSLIPVDRVIGKKKMAEITDTELRKLFDKLSYDYVKSSLRKSFATTKMIFEIALENRDIAANPFVKLKCSKSRKVVDNEKSAYTDEDILHILNLSKKYNPVLFPIFAILECTGMRPGELRALEWSKVDLKNKSVKIVQAVSKDFEDIKEISVSSKSKEYISVTKSVYGVRTLKLSDLAVQALIDWRSELDTYSAPMKNCKFVFPSQEGNFRSETSLNTLIRRFIKSAGLEDVGLSLYRFRHTMCTRLILDGQPIPVIQRIMGDNTIDVIMKIYTHVTEEQALASCGNYYDRLNKKHQDIAV